MYGTPVTQSIAFPEILKVILGTLANHYTWPRIYRFAAPKGCGQGLANIIDSPSLLKPAFLHELTKDNSVLARQLGGVSQAEVVSFVEYADFSIFGALELHELVQQHSGTRWHGVRFGVPLPPRPEAPAPHPTPQAIERRYIAKLMDVYNETNFDPPYTPDNIHAQHPRHGRHFERQRVAFYSAEALRVFARDAVPAGTFEALQREILDGVIETHDRDHECGMDRLYAVTEVARNLPLAANGLVPVVYQRDRTGICHQLSDVDDLTWCDE
ncbi:MAG: hypothetical protein CMH83_02540 [Nocardioides sp.]|nr:hypothetical protein [Nocardioides sp.]